MNHEQGHFSLAVLLARDFFLDLMGLKGNTYQSKADAESDFNALKNDRNSNFVKIIKKYDDLTKHGTVAAEQAKWDGFIHKAFTVPKAPAEQAADGAPIKVRLLDVLSQGGIVI